MIAARVDRAVHLVTNFSLSEGKKEFLINQPVKSTVIISWHDELENKRLKSKSSVESSYLVVSLVVRCR